VLFSILNAKNLAKMVVEGAVGKIDKTRPLKSGAI